MTLGPRLRRSVRPLVAPLRRWAVLARSRARPRGDDPAECSVCGLVVASFEPAGNRRVTPDRRCPRCGSLERQRMMWLYFAWRTELFSAPLRMLHLAPERSIGPRLAAAGNLDYTSADLRPGAAMVTMDITAIDEPDGSYDVIYASHVLEHIDDDRRAMAELCRILRPGGWAALQVPIWGETTREEPIADPAERIAAYGQADHVRMYGHDGVYEERLGEAGFSVTVEPFVRSLDPVLARRHRLGAHEDIYVCTRPWAAS